MASKDKLSTRYNSDGVREVWAVKIGGETFPIAGGDGKAEAERKANEMSRVEAESGRKSSETARAEAEKARKAAENARAAQQAKNNADQRANNAAAQGLQVVKLSGGQYDPSTLKPNVPGEVGKLYFVPDPKGGSDSLYAEWMHIDGKFEKVGMSTAQIAGLTTGQIDAVASGGSVTSEAALTGTGLTYLWTKLRAAFAAKSHRHATAQVDGLESALAGKASKADLDEMRGSLFQSVADSPASDLNALTTPGAYGVASPKNQPQFVSGAVSVLVMPMSDGASQLLVSASNGFYSRVMQAGRWTNWQQN